MISDNRVVPAGVLISPGKAEELQVHVLDEVELAVFRLVINFLRVVIILHRKHLDVVRISVVMAAKEPIFLSSQPPLPKGKLLDVS